MFPRFPHAFLLALATSFAACGREESPPVAPIPVDTPASRVDSYEVSGVVRSLPVTGDPTSAFMVQHEAIPDFRSEMGDVVGMKAMTMPFALGEGVDLANIAVGDAVQMKFQVRWGDRPGMQVTFIEKR